VSDKAGQSSATSIVDKSVHAVFSIGRGPVDNDSSSSSSSSDSSSDSQSAGESTQQQQQQRYESVDVSVALKKLWSARLRKMVLETGTRSDGRKTDEVTEVKSQTSLFSFGRSICSEHTTKLAVYSVNMLS
jgi:polyribonucleotide nucleotidyltransferase